MRLLLTRKNFLTLFTITVFIFLSSSVSFAPTKLMSDAELSDTDAQAFFNITQLTNAYGSQNVIHIDLGVQQVINAHIDSFKMGYYNNGGGWGWDMDYTDYYWGSTDMTSDPLVWNGIFLEFGFDNIGTAATRTLNYIDFGTFHATGPITANINKLNGIVLDSGTGQNNGVMIRQTASGRRTINFNNEVLSFLFAQKYVYTDQGGTSTTLSGIFQKLPSSNTSVY